MSSVLVAIGCIVQPLNCLVPVYLLHFIWQVAIWTCDQEVMDSRHGCSDFGQVVHTPVPLSPSSIICYQLLWSWEGNHVSVYITTECRQLNYCRIYNDHFTMKVWLHCEIYQECKGSLDSLCATCCNIAFLGWRYFVQCIYQTCVSVFSYIATFVAISPITMEME